MVELIHEDNYAKEMDEVVIPWLTDRKTAGTFSREPGKELYYEHFSGDSSPDRQLILLHGFSESLPKWYESVYYLVKNGFSVWMLQQREHGKSFRSTSDPSLIHLEDYSALIEDLHFFASEMVRKQSGMTPSEPLYLFAHSMGGGVGVCCMERYPDDFAKAVLSSPMLEMTAGGTPVALAKLLCMVKDLLGKGRQYMAGSAGFSPVPDFAASLDNSEARYLYSFETIKAHQEYQMCIPSYHTALQFLRLTKEATARKNCRRIKAQVLLLQSGRDSMVGLGGQNELIRRIPRGKLEVFPDAKHELYMQGNPGLEKYWKMVFDFYDSNEKD